MPPLPWRGNLPCRLRGERLPAHPPQEAFLPVGFLREECRRQSHRLLCETKYSVVLIALLNPHLAQNTKTRRQSTPEG